MSDRLTDALKHFCEKLRTSIGDGNEVAIITHLDADGITAGSILATALRRMGARYCVRAISDMNSSVIESMKADGHDFYVITDLGAGWTSNLRNALDNNKWVIIDHHEITEQEILTEDEGSQILNPWKFSIDGGREVSSGGMAYMVASVLDSKNRDLSAIAVVSAVGDRQDQGDKSAIVEAVAKFVGGSDKRLSDILVDDLKGYVYTLGREDKRSILRDAREFSTVLNACGRMGMAGVGIAICMGDRNTALSAGEEILSTYKMTLRNNISTIFSEKWRLADDGKTTFVN